MIYINEEISELIGMYIGDGTLYKTNRGLVWGNKEFKICLAGKNNLEKFIKEVSPKNKKHLNKYFRWKQRGHNNPLAGMAQSGTAQKLNGGVA